MSEDKRREIELTAERIEALNTERKRTATGSRNLLKGKTLKLEIKDHKIEGWRTGKVRTAPEEEYAYVIELYAALPTMIELTSARKAAITAEKERTGIGSRGFMSRAHNPPPGLKATRIDGWLNHVKHAPEAEYEYVLDEYRKFPSTLNEEELPRSPALDREAEDYQWRTRRCHNHLSKARSDQ